MKKFKLVQKIVLLMVGIVVSGALVSCYESSSEKAAPLEVTTTPGDGGGTTTPGLAFNGKVYYQQNCSLCHAAGTDDTTTAFSTITAMDLAKQDSLIKSDISTLDKKFNTMGRFKNIDQERVNDLKKYLSGL